MINDVLATSRRAGSSGDVPAITTSTLTDAGVGVAYSQQIVAAGTVSSWSMRVFDDDGNVVFGHGLSIDSAGLITGTPDVPTAYSGLWTVEITASGPSAQDRAELQLRVYHLKDDFTTAASAPLAGTRNCEPFGQLTIVDADNELSVTLANQLQFAGLSPAYSNPQIRSASAYARKAGRAVFFKIKIPTSLIRDNSTISFGWDLNGTFDFSSEHALVNISRASGFAASGFATAKTILWTFDVTYTFAVVLRATGAHYFVRGGAYSTWTHVFTIQSITTTPLYAGRQWGASAGMPEYTHAMYVADLPDPLLDDSFYDHYAASPANNATAIANANGAQYLNWTPSAGQTLEISFRRTDDNNRMVLRCSQSGSTMKIVEIDGGAETELSSAAATFTAGAAARIAVRYAGGVIQSWKSTTTNNSPLNVINDVSGSDYNLAVTGIKVSGFTTAAEWYAWPYTASASVAAALTALGPGA